jgi:ActR/RegA family two-component response regulator
MTLHALLLSRDPEVLGPMRRMLADVHAKVEVCRGPCQAVRLLQAERFDAVLVDCDDMDGAADVLMELRQSTGNRGAIRFAILNGLTSVGTAFRMGASFVLDKPLCWERTARSLRAAAGLAERERRRYDRYPVDLAVSVTLPGAHAAYARAANLSEEGMLLETVDPIPAGSRLEVRFDLPGRSTPVEARGEVAWSDQQGHAGIRFLEILQMSRLQYRRWLAEKTAQERPHFFVDATRRAC